MAFYSVKIRYSICLLILCGFFEPGFGQEGALKIKGIIYDEKGGTLPFTSVYLFNSASGDKPLKGTQSIENGSFQLDVTPGNYRIQVSLVGYKAYSREIMVNTDTSMGKIQLVPDSKLLGEVKITGKKPLVSRKIDRYVLNVSESILASGRGTFELLNYAPGVMTMGSSIGINGNTATKIMVNGRLLRLSRDQVQNYLTNLRSEEVESIEIIPNPGAEFEAEGGGGLINVILKKQRVGGLDGTVGIGAMTPKNPSYNTSAQLNYGYKGWQLYGSHNYTKSKVGTELEDNRFQEQLTYKTNINTITATRANNFRFGAAYDISKNQYIGLEFNGNNNKSDAGAKSIAVLNDPLNNKFNNIKGDFLTRNDNKIYTLSFNYDLKIDTLGSSFGIISDYTTAKRNGRGDFLSHYTDQQNTPLFDSLYRNSVPVKIDNYNAAANYVKAFKNGGKLKFGLKFTVTNTRNNVLYEYYKTDGFVNDPERSNIFQYKEQIAAAYGQYSFRLGKTSFQVGLRAESTKTKGSSVTSGQNHNRSYFNLFPSLFLKRVLDDKNTLSFNYSRRLDRPSFNSLNPFEWRVDDYTYISGNPYLNPQFIHSFNLSYLYASRYSLSLFANQTKGVFAQYLLSNKPGDLVANYSWENLSSQKYLGLNLYVPVEVAKWWSMINNVMVYKNIIDFDSGESRRTVFSGKTTQNVSLNKDLRLEVSGLYQSKYNTSNQVFVPSYYIDLGLSNSFFKKKVTARALVTDVFNTSRNDYEIISGSLNLTEKQKYTTRRFSIQLTYNFRIGKKVKIQKITGGNNDEKNRM